MWRVFAVAALQSACLASASALIYGTAWKRERTHDLVTLAIKQGFRAFDTANMPMHYNESLLGKALTEALADPSLGLKREDLWIQTKFTPDACSGVHEELYPYDPTADVAAQVQQSFKGSLEHLGVSYVDSLLLHAPLPTLEESLKVWREMEKLHAEGKAKKIGVSNFNLAALQALVNSSASPPTIVQNRCMMQHKWDEEVRGFCREHGVQYQGFWLLTGNRFLFEAPPVVEIAKGNGKTPEQVIFQYAIQGLGVTALTGPADAEHMRQDLELGKDSFVLRPEELKTLGAIEPPAFTSSDRVSVLFENTLGEEVRLYWLNTENGQLTPTSLIQPGTRGHVSTYHSHQFVAMRGPKDAVLKWRADRAQGEEQLVRIDMRLNTAFLNAGTVPLKVFWRDDEGKEHLQGDIPPGERLGVNAGLSHTFVAKTEDGTVVREWRAEITPDSTDEVVLQHQQEL